MTDPVGALLTELADAMQGVTTPFTRADEADRIYEGYLFAQVIATAAECGGRVTYEDCYEKEVQNLVFRGAPGVIHARRRSFTHAVLYFGAARPVEVHLRVKVQWKNFDGESDVLLIDTKAARECRDKQQLPKPSGCVLTIEGKYYPLGVPRFRGAQVRRHASELPAVNGEPLRYQHVLDAREQVPQPRCAAAVRVRCDAGEPVPDVRSRTHP